MTLTFTIIVADRYVFGILCTDTEISFNEYCHSRLILNKVQPAAKWRKNPVLERIVSKSKVRSHLERTDFLLKYFVSLR